MEELIKLALERLNNLDLEQNFLTSRKAVRLIIANTFVNNLEIIQSYGDKDTNELMDNYLLNINESFKKCLIENFPWVKIPGCQKLELIKKMGLVKLALGTNIKKADIARSLGVSRALVTYWIAGKRPMKIKYLFKILNLSNKQLYIKGDL